MPFNGNTKIAGKREYSIVLFNKHFLNIAVNLPQFDENSLPQAAYSPAKTIKPGP
jgi:hypothetical protein